MKLPIPHLSRLLLALAATALLSPASRAKDDDSEHNGATARVKFSNPAKPGTLKFSLPWAEARITGTDGNEVIVTSSLDQKGRAEVDHEGFRRLDEDVTFELTEKGNVATLSIAGDNIWASHGAEFEIKVPRNTNLVIRTEAGGDLEVDGVEGDLDINSMNGEIKLEGISSSAVVNTMNGEIKATFKHAPTKAVSLSSMNGEIDLRLPSDTKANLRMRTNNGSIRTDFPDGVLKAKPEKTSRGMVSVSADVRTDVRVEASEREVERQMAREAARADREQAKISRDVAKALADANKIAATVNASLQSEGIPPIPPVPPMPPMPNFGGKTIVGTLNGGGIDIKLTSMNGRITLGETK